MKRNYGHLSAGDRVVIMSERDDVAASFHRKYGFIPFSDDARRVFPLMSTMRQLQRS